MDCTVTRRRSSHPQISTLSATLLTTSQGRDNSHPYTTLHDSVCLPPILSIPCLSRPRTSLNHNLPPTSPRLVPQCLIPLLDIPRYHLLLLAQPLRPCDHDVTLLHLVSSPRPHPRSLTHTPSIIPTAPAVRHQKPLIIPIPSLVPLSVPRLD